MHTRFLPVKPGAATAAQAVLAKPRTKPVSEWPLWAKALYKVRREGEKGVGDTIVRLIGKDRSDLFKAWFKRKVGKDCGCSDRQEWLNRHYPYL